VNWRAAALCGVVSAAALATGCSARTVELPAATAATAPTAAPRPAAPGDSPQLAALVPRDVAGLPPQSASAQAGLLPAAVAALQAQVPGAQQMERISVYERFVFFTFVDESVAGRAVTAIYDAEAGLRLADPDLSSEKSYPLAAVDPNVPAALVAGIEGRFPSVHVTSVDLRRSLSYGFGLAWYLTLEDAAGGLATVFADLGGTVIAVDPY
jgi:hypothetical protein